MRRFVITEESMSPSLNPGDRFLARRQRRPRRGTVVFFPHPHRPDFWLVKRVIGLPGEPVTIRDGRVWINGTTLEDPWGSSPTEPGGSWHVPEDHVFVLSDARHRTRADSRSLGPVPIRGSYVARMRYRSGLP